MNINNFIAAVSHSNGFAAPNRYQIYIPTQALYQSSTTIWNVLNTVSQFPDFQTNWMSEYLDTDMKNMSYELTAFCEKAELPGYQFQLETNRHYGPQFKVAHMPEYNDITLTFMCGSDMLERYFFESWMYMIMDPVTNDFNYRDEYATDINIVQYNYYASGYDYTVPYNYYLPPGKQNAGYNMGIGPAGYVPDGTSKPYGNGTFAPTGWRQGGAFTGNRFSHDFDYSVDANYYITLNRCYPIAINSQELSYDNNNTVQKLQVTFTYFKALPFNGSGSNPGRRGSPEVFTTTAEATDGSTNGYGKTVAPPRMPLPPGQQSRNQDVPPETNPQ